MAVASRAVLSGRLMPIDADWADLVNDYTLYVRVTKLAEGAGKLIFSVGVVLDGGRTKMSQWCP